MLALWLPDLYLPLGNSDDGRILARFGLQARNFWELGPSDSQMGAVVEPYWRGEYNVAPRSTPPAEAVSYAHHPPLQLFISIASFGIFGENLFALRFAGFLLGTATVAFMAALLRVRGLPWAPTLLAVAAMASTGFFHIYARIGVGFSLIVASTAAIAWLKKAERPPLWAISCTAILLGCAAMQSWIAMAAVALLVIWLFISQLSMNMNRGLNMSREPNLNHEATTHNTSLGHAFVSLRYTFMSPTVLTVALGAILGVVITVAWILNAANITELIEWAQFRANSSTASRPVNPANQFGFVDFLKRQWHFASLGLMVPVWMRVLMLPALIVGLIDRRTRIPTAVTLFVAAAWTFVFQQGAWVHMLWNFPWLAPVTIGLAATLDAIRKLLPPTGRLIFTALASSVIIVTIVLVFSGSTRNSYLTEPSDAGRAIEQIRHTEATSAADGIWIANGIPTARWAAYYLDIPVWPLKENRIELLQTDDLVMLRTDRIPDWFMDSVDTLRPVVQVGRYQIVQVIVR